ncbi:MAG: gliding motility-associated-like protein, partial [Granulosicoccus sp.]
NIVVWDWSFGDGDESSLQHPFHLYTDTGLFNVILEVENNFGCLDSVSSKIEIYPDYTMYIPNSFTPDNDGINDVFKPMGDGFFQQSYSFKIFDRWGEEIFHTANYEIGWDGTYKGAQVETSAFTYQVKAIDLNNFNREHFGHLTLTR